MPIRQIKFPVVFLDIDGVLVTSRTLKQRHPTFECNRFDPPCVKALNQITRKSEAAIVVSSTWRIGPAYWWPRLIYYMKLEGVEAPVVGKTPDLGGHPRGREIQKWIEDNGPLQSFVILDDDSDMEDLGSRLVRTSMQKGLTPELAKLATALLVKNG